MTNEQIIFNSRLELLDKGILKSTGRMVVVEDSEGKKSFVAEPEQIHTYSEWKRKGYTVKEGEKAITQFSIWQKNGSAYGKNLFMRKASFFKESQVERTEEVVAV